MKNMNELKKKIEAILLFKNEPVTVDDLSKWVAVETAEVREALKYLQEDYRERGIVIVSNGNELTFGTSPEFSDLIGAMQKEELSRELGRAGLETLAIILYRGPISRREIDRIRGVNSGFILRSLLMRGLIEKVEPLTAGGAGRSVDYKPTLKLFEHLGISGKEELPEYQSAFGRIEEFMSETEQEKKADE